MIALKEGKGQLLHLPHGFSSGSFQQTTENGMEFDRKLMDEWIQIWSDINAIDEVVALAAKQRALPKDIEEARRCLDRFNRSAHNLIDRISGSVLPQCEPQSSSCGN